MFGGLFMRHDPFLQMLAPFAWVMVAAFALGFAAVVAVSAPILSRDSAALSQPTFIAAPALPSGGFAKAI